MSEGLMGNLAIREAKRVLRTTLLTERAVLPPAIVEAASLGVMGHLMAWPAFQAAALVLTYTAFRNEINLAPLLDQFPDEI